MRNLAFIITSCFLTLSANAIPPPYLKEPGNKWVDSLLAHMTLEEKVGQLFMVAAYSNKDESHYQEIERFIRDYHIGGLIFFQGNIPKQAELTNRYQGQSKTPLWIGMDAEWGLGMRLDNTISYPRQLMLGSIENDQLIYEMGAEIARQLKRLGVHINFAPDIDVNNNPNNPVINDRSFGENRYNVTSKGIMYMLGMQNNHVLACGKHFPGHGNTDVDSHHDLPVLKQSRDELERTELYPFRKLIDRGVGSIMVAHMNVLALDSTPNLPSTLSSRIVDSTLKGELGFQGLVFTDALNMKGISKFYPSGVAEVKALLAGNDVLLFPEKVDSAVAGIIRAICDTNILSETLINEKVRKILLAKYWLHLNQYKPLDTANIEADINSEQARFVKNKLVRNAITVVSDKDYLIPLVNLQQRIAHLGIGSTSATAFGNRLDDYGNFDHFQIAKDDSKKNFKTLLDTLKTYDLVVIELHNMSRFASKNYGITDNSLDFLYLLEKQNRSILCVFGSPYSLKYFQNFHTILVAYNEEDDTKDVAAQVLMGARGAEGTLPVSIDRYPFKQGVCTPDNLRLRYGSPLELGVSAKAFDPIDSIVSQAIRQHVMPGCQILVAKDGLVLYRKSFGSKTYEADSDHIRNGDLYDIASCTKITATLPVIMKMQENGNLDLNKKLGDYYSYPIGCDKKNIGLRDLLTHQAGLPAWIPFYKNSLDSSGLPDSLWYSKTRKDCYTVRLGDSLWLDDYFQDSVRSMIYHAPLNPAQGYKYSDLAYYLLKEIIESRYGDSLESVARKQLYAPIGMNYTLYNPKWKGIPLNTLVPTERENGFRNCLIWGTVHDQGAALFGGVGGHAGLFSTSNDLAKYMQLLLNDGQYGGLRYFDPETIKLFTTKQFPDNRRGLGFDKPTAPGTDGPTCVSASPLSFGHTGFTGTIMWADPKYDLVFIFLSNRVYPSAGNKQLIEQNIRPKIQQVVYDALKLK